MPDSQQIVFPRRLSEREIGERAKRRAEIIAACQERYKTSRAADRMARRLIRKAGLEE
jgi:hypothetical protein